MKSKNLGVGSLLVLLVLLSGVSPITHATADVKYVPICIDDFCITMPIIEDYVVKTADFNGDNVTDLYVTGDSAKRFVPDFIVYRKYIDPGYGWLKPEFTVNSAPNAAQRSLAASLRPTPITVSRIELNGDAFYDFYLRNVDEAIANEDDIIITLQRGLGHTVSHALPVDEFFEDVVKMFTEWLSAPEGFYDFATTPYCSYATLYVPSAWVNVIEPGINGNPDDPWFGTSFWSNATSFYQDASGYMYGFAPHTVEDCVAWVDIMGPQAMYLFNALVASRTATDDYWTVAWCQVLQGHYGRSCPNQNVIAVGGAAVYGAIGLAALIMAILHYTGQISADERKDLADAIDSALKDGWRGSVPIPPDATERNAEDVGPGTNAVPATGVDKYAGQDNCNRGSNNSRTNRGILQPGASGNLRTGMNEQGCGCPPGSDAHHILPKGSGRTFPADLKYKIRNCLDQAGIDIDHPANGVCLPRKADPNSKAMPHGRANGKTYWADIAERCSSAYDSGGAQGVRNMLDQARRHLINGNAWWKPGNLPFNHPW